MTQVVEAKHDPHRPGDDIHSHGNRDQSARNETRPVEEEVLKKVDSAVEQVIDKNKDALCEVIATSRKSGLNANAEIAGEIAGKLCSEAGLSGSQASHVIEMVKHKVTETWESSLAHRSKAPQTPTGHEKPEQGLADAGAVKAPHEENPIEQKQGKKHPPQALDLENPIEQKQASKHSLEALFAAQEAPMEREGGLQAAARKQGIASPAAGIAQTATPLEAAGAQVTQSAEQAIRDITRALLADTHEALEHQGLLRSQRTTPSAIQANALALSPRQDSADIASLREARGVESQSYLEGYYRNSTVWPKGQSRLG